MITTRQSLVRVGSPRDLKPSPRDASRSSMHPSIATAALTVRRRPHRLASRSTPPIVIARRPFDVSPRASLVVDAPPRKPQPKIA
jgi:hypothetical protein